jgi:polyhydroxyalkanoate synthase
MRERGVLDAKQMEGTFAWLRANDLVWTYVVNNWFMGRRPPAFDILRWNADSTNLPAAMHSQYLRACYLDNALVRPGAFVIADTRIDLGKIRNPLYVLGAENDHIAPWRSSFRTLAHVGSDDVTYTLSNAGHIAGIVNPPSPKAWHRTKPRAARDESADAWLASSERRDETWWEDWARWASARAGKRVAPYRLPKGEPSPGRYVRNETAPPLDLTRAAPEEAS